MDDIFELDGQIISDSFVEEEEEEEKIEQEGVTKTVSFANDEILQSNSCFEKIDFSEFDLLSNNDDFPANTIDIIDQYLQEYQNIVLNGSNISPDDSELFNKRLTLAITKSESSKLSENEEKKHFKLEFLLRLASFYLISFLATHNISYSNLFLENLRKYDDFIGDDNPFFSTLQKRYCILISVYLVITKFDSFESIANAISWCSFEENHSFENEIFAPYVCIADGIRFFSHHLYKLAALRSYTAFKLFPVKDIEMKKKCLVLYYFSSLLITYDIKIRPKSIQNHLNDSIIKNHPNFLNLKLSNQKQLINPNNESDTHQEDSSNDLYLNNSENNHDENSNTTDNDKYIDIDPNKIYYDDENLKLIFNYIKYHQKCDFESAALKAKELCQQVGRTYKFALYIPFNNLSKIVKKRAIIRFLSVFKRVQVDFIYRKFSFNSIEETKKILIEMIYRKEINHFYNDVTDTLEIVDQADEEDDSKKEYSPVNLMKKADELLNSFIDSF